MAADHRPQTAGRDANAAQPLGSRRGVVSDEETKKTGRQERKTAGPDGGDAAYVGEAAKGKR
jgi:hypothetical protein